MKHSISGVTTRLITVGIEGFEWVSIESHPLLFSSTTLEFSGHEIKNFYAIDNLARIRDKRKMDRILVDIVISVLFTSEFDDETMRLGGLT